MSPLKCSNFFSVSSLKEPPEGHQRDRVRQIRRSALTQAGMAGFRGLGATTLHRVACWGHCYVMPPGSNEVLLVISGPGMCQALCQ